MASNRDPWTIPGDASQHDYVKLIQEVSRYYRDASLDIWTKANDWWDLFLAIQEDLRDPLDEQWRSDVFVPLPYATTRTKAAATVDLLGNTEPVWQVEATRETGTWYEQSKYYERLLDYVFRMNAWRKFLYKVAVARSVQGTAFMKVVWSKRAHVMSLPSSAAEQQRYQELLMENLGLGAPSPPDHLTEPQKYEQWRHDLEISNRFKPMPVHPDLSGGPKEVVQYEGPLFQLLPLWRVRLDPMIDEIENQRIIIHSTIKPLSEIMARADNDPNSPLPYYKDAVEAALQGWTGQVLEQEEQELAQSLGLNPQDNANPLFTKPIKLEEVWSRSEEYKYAIIMNEKFVINKTPRQWPLLTYAPNIFALRNVIVPGHFYGLSDYQEPEKLFKELNTFRRIRMDGATLTTLPVFVKQSGVQLSEQMKKLKPGMILTLPTKDAISSLIKHTMPAESYREPAEIKMEIADATEVYDTTKGAPATVGRVTGVEYQGRAGQVSIKQKIDVAMVEEELLNLPSVILSMFAQMGPDRIKKNVGGDPDALVDVTREQLVEAINYRFRFRGATKHINPDLQVQQLNQALAQFKDVLMPAERRMALQLIMEMLDIRGYSKILTIDGTTQQTVAGATAMNAQNQTNQTQANMAEAGGVQVPPQLDAAAAQSIVGGGGPPNAG